jgi:hypothetical protein
MSYERVRKSAAVTLALMAFAIWASMTPASASPPVGTPGTPALFTNQVVQPIGIAADQNRILVTQPYCPGTAFSPTPPSFTVQSLSAAGVPTLYASITEPYDAAALQGLVTFNVGNNGQSDPASSNCGEMHIVISQFAAFGAGAVYTAFGGHIYKITGAAPGTVTLFADIPTLDGTNPHTDLGFDQTGGFGNNLMIVGTNDTDLSSEIYEVTSAGVATKVATVSAADAACTGGNAFNGCIEGADFLPAAGLSGLYGSNFYAELGRNSKVVMVAPTTFATTILANQTAGVPYTAEYGHTIPSTFCTAAPGGVDTGKAAFIVNFDVFHEATGFPTDADCISIAAGTSIYGYPTANFAGLSGQIIQDTEANGVGDSGYVITSGSATATTINDAIFDGSCYENEDLAFVTCVPNVCKDTTLTWGYWKTHTGSGAPKQDPTYLKLSTTCPAVGGVGAISLDGDCDNSSDLFKPTVITCAKKADCGAQSADALFAGGNVGSVNCSGNCVTLFAAQLLAAELSVVGNPALAGAIYSNPANPSDPFNGQTLGAILTALQTAFDVYVDGGAISCGGKTGSFSACQNTLDAINNSSESTHTLNCGTPTVAAGPTGPGGPGPVSGGGKKHKHKHKG